MIRPLHPCSRRARRPLAAVLALSAMLPASAAFAGDPAKTVLDASAVWPMFGGDVKHTFRSRFVGPDTPHVLPPTKIGNLMNNQAAVTADGYIIFGAGFSTWGVLASGRIMWGSRVGAEAQFSGAALDDNGNLYIGGRDNQLWKKEQSTGLALCKRYIDSDSDIKGSPTISVKFPDRVYVPSAGRLYAIGTSGAAGACTLLWEVPLEAATMSSVSLADSVPGAHDSLGNLIIASGSSIYAIRDDGPSATVVNRVALGGYIQGPTPLVHPETGNIYVGDQKKRFHALRPDFTPLVAPKPLGSRIFSSAALSPDGQTLYVPTQRGELHALNVDTLATVPGFPFSPSRNKFLARGYAPVVDAEGTVYVGGQDRYVRAIRPDGSVKWTAKVGAKIAPATVVDKGLIVPCWDGYLYRICPPATGPDTAQEVCGFTIDTTAP